MSIKIMNTVKDHYSTEVLQQQQQQTDIYNFDSTYPQIVKVEAGGYD